MEEKRDHESYARLMDALRTVANLKLDGSTDLGAALGGSAGWVGNWKTRGVAVDGALSAQERYGINALWILKGLPPVMITQPASQSVIYDPDKLGTALTSMDKALEGTHIQGTLGKLANTLLSALAAQQKHYPNGVPEAARPVYDDLVASYLERDLDEQRRLVGRDPEEGAQRDRESATKGAKTRASKQARES